MSGDVLFESPFLEALAFSFNNRRKAIGNQSSKAQPGKDQ
jgi:hypothetical protein